MTGNWSCIIDSHHHLWARTNAFHQWPGFQQVRIFRDYLPDDFARVSRPSGVTGSIVVQAQEDIRETFWLLSLAEQHDWIAGVVGWVDFSSTEAPELIGRLARYPKLKALRPMLQDMDDVDWLLSREVMPALWALAQNGLRLDALVRPRHLNMIRRFCRLWDEIPVVIDHAAKPDLSGAGFDHWCEAMNDLSEHGVACKFSGLHTELPLGGKQALLVPFVETLFSLFSDRLMWGSDWPVCLLAQDDYEDTLTYARNVVSENVPERGRSIFADSAIAFYGLAQKIQPEGN